jgi:uracil-DNA glycosylase
MPVLPQVWQDFLAPYMDESEFQRLMAQVDSAYAAATVYPPRQELFSAFHLTAPQDVKAVILGQDPYHEPGQAHGLAFSVKEGVKYPPSLRNIFTELAEDVGSKPLNGNLTPWAEQGVLLLNTVLTVEASKAASHKNLGWQNFTDVVIAALSRLPQPVAFVLWGSHAQKKAAIAEGSPYPRLVLQAPHPSPLSSYRGFFGSKPFSKINIFLESQGVSPIGW